MTTGQWICIAIAAAVIFIVAGYIRQETEDRRNKQAGIQKIKMTGTPGTKIPAGSRFELEGTWYRTVRDATMGKLGDCTFFAISEREPPHIDSR